MNAKNETSPKPAELPPLASPAWDRSLPLLSYQWLEAASCNRWHQFRTGDRTAEAVHKAKKSALRRCARDVKVYESALTGKDAELASLRALLREAQNSLFWFNSHAEVLKYHADMSEVDELHVAALLRRIQEATQ